MNPLAIRIAADLKAFKANMDEMRVQLETNASAMKRMSSAFDGSKAIGDANAMVKAIHDIGGASKLTEAEQRRVNATVTEALAKYKALGREAPPELLALRDATKKVGDEVQKQPSMMDNLNAKTVALGAAIGSALGGLALQAVNRLGSELGEFARQGLQLQAVQGSFEKLAAGTKSSSAEMLSSMQKASRGMVSEFDLMKAGNKAMLLGLPVTAESMGTLAKAATTLGRAMGLDATKAIDDLTTALGRSSPMILDNLGLSVKVGEANEIYAAKLGKTAEQLTDAEKKTAFYEEAMRKAEIKTKELGDQTKTLGERLQTAWVSVGNVVTGVVSDYNIGLGVALSGTAKFAQFLDLAMKTSLGSAVHMFAEMERGKSVVDKLTESEKLAAAALFKKGETVQQVAKYLAVGEAAVQSYSDSLKKGKKETVEITDEQKKFNAAVADWNGKKAAGELDELRKVINAAGGAAALSVAKYAQLEDRLSSLRDEGAKVDGEFGAILRTHDLLNAKIPVTTTAYAGLFAMMRTMPSVKLDMAPVPQQQVPSSSDPYGIINQIERSLIRAGKDTRIKLAAAPAVKTWIDGFVSFMGQSASNLGNSILAAIEGGGNVAMAGVASIAQSAGQYFGAKFAEATVTRGGQTVKEMSAGMAQIAAAGLSAIIGVATSIIGDMLTPVYTALEQLSMKYGRSVEEVTTRLRGMGAAGVKAFEDMTRVGGAWADLFKSRFGGMNDAESMFGLLDQFQTKEELNEIAEQWGAVYQYMQQSGEYTAAALTEAWKRYQDAVEEAVGAVGPEDTRPVGARGFPTKAQLDQAVREAKEAYDYVRDSGLYTADVIDQAWDQWQEAMIRSGDETAKRMQKLKSEIASLQEAVEAETPEYDADGVRIYGVEERRNIERLEALEKERSELVQKQIAAEADAREIAAARADEQANKEFEAFKLRAISLDEELRRIFSKGYEIPLTFKLPAGAPGAGVLPPSGGGPWDRFSSYAPTSSGVSSGVPLVVTMVNVMDGEVVARKTVRHTARLLPSHLDLIGAQG